jgi:hypothetical protein
MFFEGLPVPAVDCDVQVFRSAQTATTTQMHTWRRPQGKNMAYLLAIGGGGGGGGGFTAAAAAARGGGGGGGSSSFAALTIPLFAIPSTLLIQVGSGGAGATGTGGNGIPSRILHWPDSTAVHNVILDSCNTVTGNGGAAGTGASGGAGGSSATAPTVARSPLMQLGFFATLQGGTAGAAGGAQTGANGSVQNFDTVTGKRTMGGCGGAGTTSADFIGGAITAISSAFFSEMKPQTPAAGSNSAGGSYTLLAPLFGYAGIGGSSSNAGVGGDGGDGGVGCGGGGGGGGTTGGRGGRGGDGLVVIICW